MRPRIRTEAAILVAVAILPTSTTLGQATNDEPTARFAGLARPPRQADRWDAPATRIPPGVVAAARILFDQGFADPRGCEYRAVRLVRDTVAGLGGPQRVEAAVAAPEHAWVLPAEGPDAPRFAVAWNGLIYPIEALGVGADLEADVRALVDGARKDLREHRRGPHAFSGEAGWPFGAFGAMPHAASASRESLMPAKVVMLLRLGRADLAEALLEAGTGRAPAAAPQPSDDPLGYHALASAWAWAMLDRASGAHEKGDDALARADLRALTRLVPLVEAKCAELGLPRPVAAGNAAGPAPYLGFAAPASRLLADQERRAREPRRRPAKGVRVDDQPERIAALIRNLDQLTERDMGVYFVLGHASNGPESELAKEGEAAIPALLQCLEGDERLTRIILRDRRHDSRWLAPRGVEVVARATLQRILGTTEVGGRNDGLLSPDERASAASELRAFWEKTRGLDALGRELAVLADDGAGPDRWLEAARALVLPVGPVWETPRGRRPVRLPLRGEPLRSREAPSVSDLMARRIAGMDPGEANARDADEMILAYRANDMAELLARWDLPRALPVLRARVRRCIALDRARQPGMPFDGFAGWAGTLTSWRIRGGDPDAFADYAGWVRDLDPEVYQNFPSAALDPFWRDPENPRASEVLSSLFDRPGSPWMPILAPRGKYRIREIQSQLLVSPMLGFGVFRRRVIDALDDHAEVGSVECDEDGRIAVKLPDRTEFPSLREGVPDRPAPRSRMPVRKRDEVADMLKGVEGMPYFEHHWPEARKGRAIEEMKRLLGLYGDRYRPVVLDRRSYDPLSQYPHPPRAELSFPPLDHPASTEEASAGLAIFSLGRGAETRVWRMPAPAMPARWTSLAIPPDDPILLSLPAGKPVHPAQIEVLQGGWAWQAEEVRRGDRWERIYGFVGRHVVAAVPASEIDFPADEASASGFLRFTRDLEASLIPPGMADGRGATQRPVPAGAPLPLTVRLRNRRGIEATAPVELVRKGDGITFRDGTSIRLFRANEGRPRRSGSQGQDEPTREFEVVPWRRPGRHAPAEARVLSPTEVVEVLKVDLRELYDNLKPGRYRVELRLEDRQDREGKPAVAEGTFVIEAPASGPIRSTS
ncbi:hypothetical protein OJF2_15540 [Aquisphaera giovannonii]|uniref:Uncharacterized protein n=1 Tax=Aquisphaera giovannonii TaxID=406548 RepID=A0A5B9VXP4_9BACT|nr:hypothetical protein [Aquisphaera giovannonii]QEH33058.1 hypothetical protein OJF2_15540 [Aquisphaera giovannonii]